MDILVRYFMNRRITLDRLIKRKGEFVYLAIADNLSKEKQEIESSKEVLEGLYATWLKLADYEDMVEPKPIEEWDEDYGDCLWWSFPIEEPPYCGTPLDCNFPDHVTHFTRIIIPVETDS
jgi:hypothetical protein